MIFATAARDQSLASWTHTHSDAFAYSGGVTSKLIVNNLKAAVVKWMDREAVLNPTFADFARLFLRSPSTLPPNPRASPGATPCSRQPGVCCRS